MVEGTRALSLPVLRSDRAIGLSDRRRSPRSLDLLRVSPTFPLAELHISLSRQSWDSTSPQLRPRGIRVRCPIRARRHRNIPASSRRFSRDRPPDTRSDSNGTPLPCPKSHGPRRRVRCPFPFRHRPKPRGHRNISSPRRRFSCEQAPDTLSDSHGTPLDRPQGPSPVVRDTPRKHRTFAATRPQVTLRLRTADREPAANETPIGTTAPSEPVTPPTPVPAPWLAGTFPYQAAIPIPTRQHIASHRSEHRPQNERNRLATAAPSGFPHHR